MNDRETWMDISYDKYENDAADYDYSIDKVEDDYNEDF